MTEDRQQGVFDYIVIGAGSAGCVVAERLSADGRYSVLLLEAGGADRSWTSRIPAAMIKMKREYDWVYPGTPDQSRSGRSDGWPAGRVLGGSSTINGMVWVRGHPADFDAWEDMGCTGWGYQNVLEYFKRSERFLGGGDGHYRGKSGPTVVSASLVKHVLNDAVIEAASSVGHPRNEDYNGATQIGVGPTQLNIGNGLRCSTARAYLSRARSRPNFELRTRAIVQRVVFSGSRATGVDYVSDNVSQRVTATREVIVSAGSIGSPKILMLSGIGPASDLGHHGIPVVQDSPLVGKNLIDHLGASMIWEVTERTLNKYFTPARMTKAALEYGLHRTGPIAAGPSMVMIFGRSDAATGPGSDWQVHFAPLALAGKEGGLGGMKLLDMRAMSSTLHTLQPLTRGSVSLRSSRPEDSPVVQHELLREPADVRNIAYQAEATREVMTSSAIRPYIVRELEPSSHIRNPGDWEGYLRRKSFRCLHQVGTCAMGRDGESVVDPELRVRGVDGIRVVDASIMPNITSGNTNAPTIMIAERASSLILGTERSLPSRDSR